jgi:hypothetical protein
LASKIEADKMLMGCFVTHCSHNIVHNRSADNKYKGAKALLTVAIAMATRQTRTHISRRGYNRQQQPSNFVIHLYFNVRSHSAGWHALFASFRQENADWKSE